MARRVALCLVAALAATSTAALADDKRQVCGKAYEQAQYARKDRKLREARKHLLVCAQPDCPAATKTDCTPWLSEVEASLPTVVFGATDASGKEVADVKVTVDGAPVAEKLDGAAVEVDPGPHKFRFSLAGAEDVEQDVVVREGEKNRLLTVKFGGGAAPPIHPPAPIPAAPSGPTYLPAGILTGVGVLAVGGAVIFGMGAKDDADELRTTCAPRCPSGRVDDVRSKLLVSDVFLGAGVISLGLAVYFFINPPGGKKSAPATAAAPLLDVRPQPGGATAGLTGRF
jgi:hypothetical protein